MSARTLERICWAILAVTVAAAVVLAAVGCHAPRPGYGVPRTAVAR